MEDISNNTNNHYTGNLSYLKCDFVILWSLINIAYHIWLKLGTDSKLRILFAIIHKKYDFPQIREMSQTWQIKASEVSKNWLVNAPMAVTKAQAFN